MFKLGRKETLLTKFKKAYLSSEMKDKDLLIEKTISILGEKNEQKNEP